MRALDRKLLRDMKRLWAQSLAVALVMASGVATMLIGIGAYDSLFETRAAYYERNSFAEVFAFAVRAPKRIVGEIRRLDGVAEAEARIVKTALIEIPYFELPVTGHFISIPDEGEPLFNRPVVRIGRLPEIGSSTEALVSESFAAAHGFSAGSQFDAILNGAKRRLTVAGIALSPEFIYAIGPGDMMPDDRRFGIVWMREDALASAFDLEGAFNSVSLRLLKGAEESTVLSDIDRILERYGGEGAHGRADQTSHAFFDAELKQLATMSRILPPIFLIVTAFLINMILSRLIGLEREQIGLLKAIGYSPAAIAAHYLKLVLVIAAIGLVIGYAVGTWLGFGITRFYKDFFHFPYLIFKLSTGLFAIAAIASIAAAILGAIHAVWRAASLPPAVAMQPPVPPSYRRGWIERLGVPGHFSQLAVMAFRHILRWPFRAAVTTAGIAVSVGLLVSSLFTLGAVDFMLDVTFDRADRQDASIVFGDETPARTLQEVERLPGVIAAEPYRSTIVRFSNGRYRKRVAVIGKPRRTDLSRVLDIALEPVALPQNGVVLSETLAQILHARRGDMLQVELFGNKRRNAEVPVIDIIQTYIGLASFMDIEALARVLGEQPRMSGVHLLLDPAAMPAFLKKAKEQPKLSALALQRVSLAKFRETIAENIHIQIVVYAALATIIAFGVVYNSARIQFSERARELASLRVLGFTELEVSRVLLVEFAVFTLAAIPLGWLAGVGLAYALVMGFQSELYRVPFVVTRDTLAWSALIVIAAVAVSALIVRRRVGRLDLVEVLKTRD
jgi:putative ABC transport system permease protein